ncbi:MAG TPA: HypC/HybG/HupF family hydrogenase formation chaperone [Candidatus Krumholzibacteria bacterium]|nr:HypC/HybG/HupF family hydrogenase formation chaperone [Candidatus Krumholzibacteria bacterium]
MCLGVPGRVVEVQRFDGLDLVHGKVDFGGVLREVNLSFTPEVEVGEHVMVHVGFAISVIDEEEAETTLRYLRELGEAAPEGPPPTITGSPESKS